MTPLITMEQLKYTLRISQDDAEEDMHLQFLMEAASEIVVDYLKLASVPADWYVEVSEPTTPSTVIPRLVQAAILSIAAEMYRNPEAAVGDSLHPRITRILWRLRDPAMA
jgi:hypothetical protein